MMMDDLRIAQKTKLKKIADIAKLAGIKTDELKFYGDYIAKVYPLLLNRLKAKKNGKLILVTSITPTKFGEGKTSTAVGLTQALGKLKKNVFLCLREPSLGPIFGIKGGACGGGYSQILPMEDINLHFTGDSYAVSAANNLACAILDNYIYHNDRKLDIDVSRIQIRRSSEIGDRSLRRLVFKENSSSYSSGFDITAASEIMAILSLCKDMSDLRKRIERMVVAFSKSGKPINCKDLGVSGAMVMLLKDAIMPNLVQTMEGEPAFIHCGPFANIAHGANSLISLLMALKLSDYVVTESGFGAELGAEKFFNIVCSIGKIKPDLAVIVASVRALKIHGKENLLKHINVITKFGVKPLVALNIFGDESKEDIESLITFCHDN
ncbi:MAG: formate--tetrahydrofolate ligase, partial [Candidatus Omnitrophota bacterium]